MHRTRLCTLAIMALIAFTTNSATTTARGATTDVGMTTQHLIIGSTDSARPGTASTHMTAYDGLTLAFGTDAEKTYTHVNNYATAGQTKIDDYFMFSTAPDSGRTYQMTGAIMTPTALAVVTDNQNLYQWTGGDRAWVIATARMTELIAQQEHFSALATSQYAVSTGTCVATPTRLPLRC